MAVSSLPRQIAALIVALGVLVSGAAPALASPAEKSNSATSMPGMAMDNSGMEEGRKAPKQQAPCDNSCAIGGSCAMNIALALDLAPVSIPTHRSAGLLGPDTKPDGITFPPALPPPILLA